MTRKEKDNIRRRDHRMYGAIPEGYNMHHLYYSEEYDPNSFIIISNAEHEKIHGHHVEESKGFSDKEYQKEYYIANKEHLKEKCSEYKESHKEYYSEYNKKYAKEHSEEACERSKKWREENRERSNEYMRNYKRKMRHREKLIKLGVI